LPLFVVFSAARAGIAFKGAGGLAADRDLICHEFFKRNAEKLD
jgi:hypothetical protein